MIRDQYMAAAAEAPAATVRAISARPLLLQKSLPKKSDAVKAWAWTPQFLRFRRRRQRRRRQW